jgi:monofunctional biosynthetic peptidoglycan transglycosylase
MRAASRWQRLRTQSLRLLALLLIAAAALQAYFAARVALMAVVDPASTAFQRSEAWRLLNTHGRVRWSQTWVDHTRIADHLKRAVIASEDARFVEHDGVDWDAIEQAWERNLRAQGRAEQRPGARPLRLVGGSTITQQLAKNLFLSGERTVLRKAQEFVVTQWLELLLPKRRILEIYLNHVEWGEGVFGAQAAARHYFRTDAARLGVMQSARLAVMLPAPKRFERRPHSAFLQGRAATIAARMGDVELP